MNRTPPADVRRLLRKEVGFGCPVGGCDSPYLTWHHFDPPWAEHQHHEPDGMVAMCVQHHGEADLGAFTIGQLREFKDPNRNRAEDRIRGRFRWRRDRLVLLAGGNWWTECPILLKCGPVPIIWLSRDGDGYELLNLDLFDENGVARLQLRDNDWVVDRGVEDLECAPRKAALMVRTATLGAELKVMFERADPGVVRRRAIDIARAGNRLLEDREMPDWLRLRIQESTLSPEERGEEVARTVLEGIPEEDSALCIIEGKLRWPLEITLEGAQIVLPRNNTISGSIMQRCAVGIQVG